MYVGVCVSLSPDVKRRGKDTVQKLYMSALMTHCAVDAQTFPFHQSQNNTTAGEPGKPWDKRLFRLVPTWIPSTLVLLLKWITGSVRVFVCHEFGARNMLTGQSSKYSNYLEDKDKNRHYTNRKKCNIMEKTWSDVFRLTKEEEAIIWCSALGPRRIIHKYT